MEREILGEREEGEWDSRKEEIAEGEKEVGNVGGIKEFGTSLREIESSTAQWEKGRQTGGRIIGGIDRAGLL